MRSWAAYSQLKTLGDCALRTEVREYSRADLVLREGGHAELTAGISSRRPAHWREFFADLHRWLQHVNRGNVRVERHDPGSDDQANPSS